jgi:hypothetical protein
MLPERGYTRVKLGCKKRGEYSETQTLSHFEYINMNYVVARDGTRNQNNCAGEDPEQLTRPKTNIPRRCIRTALQRADMVRILIRIF